MICKGEKYHVSERRTTLVVESSSKVTVYIKKEGEKRGRRPKIEDIQALLVEICGSDPMTCSALDTAPRAYYQFLGLKLATL